MKKTLLFAILLIVSFSNAQTVALTGDFNGWQQNPTDMLFSTTDNINYTRNNFVFANASDVKFTNGTWASSQGCSGSCFPSGTGGGEFSSNISVPAGTYNVTYNNNTKVYNFASLVTFNSLNISGTALGGNPFALVTSDGTNYSARAINLVNGNLVVNQTAPTATTWSGTTFPTGTATTGTAGIPVQAGRYNISFNRTTGAYSFNPVIFTIIGNGVGGFNDSNEIALTTTDGINYSLSNVTIVVTNGNSEVKFRENNSWSFQIGNTTWPGGTGNGSNNDPNIPAVPGTYSITLNRMTRVYNFSTLSNENFSKYNFDFYPNPTTNVWNFKSAGNVINSIIVIDALGKTVINTNPNALETTIDASSLSSGIYFAKVTSDGKVQSVKLIKN